MSGVERVDPDVMRYGRALAAALSQVLGDQLVGVYLHGSAVLGDFTPRRSDVDILAVSSGPLSDAARDDLRGALSPSALHCPGRGLEFSIVARRSLRDVGPAPPFELHVATETESGTERFVDGHARPGDTDLVMHYAVLTAHGVAVTGAPAPEVFPEVPRPLLLDALRRELDWAIENASPTYQVLNAARAWRFAEENVICSKTEGGEWARHRLRDARVVEEALAHRHGATDEHPDEAEALALVDAVRSRVDAAV